MVPEISQDFTKTTVVIVLNLCVGMFFKNDIHIVEGTRISMDIHSVLANIYLKKEAVVSFSFFEYDRTICYE